MAKSNKDNFLTALIVPAAAAVVTGVVAVTKDAYNWGKKKLKERSAKMEEDKKLQDLKDRRPWDYYNPPQKAVNGGSLTLKDRVPLWGNAIYEGCCFILYAPTDAGKTTLALQIANELAYNKESDLIPQWPIGQGRRILYFDEEYNAEHFSPELKEFYKSKSEDRVVFYNRSGSVESILDRLYSQVVKGGVPTVAFIDNIGAVCKGNNIAQEKRLMEGVWKIIRYVNDVVQPSIPLTVVLIGHTNAAKYADRFKHCAEGNLQGASEQVNYATALIELACTRKPGYYRLAFPKNKVLAKSGQVHIIRRHDALNFKYVCEMEEDKALEKNPKFTQQSDVAEPLVQSHILERAKWLSASSGEAKAEMDSLKAKLPKGMHYANMSDAEKAAILERAKELMGEYKSSRLTSAIILLEMNVYISHSAINDACKMQLKH